jgi:hypothetical protein
VLVVAALLQLGQKPQPLLGKGQGQNSFPRHRCDSRLPIGADFIHRRQILQLIHLFSLLKISAIPERSAAGLEAFKAQEQGPFTRTGDSFSNLSSLIRSFSFALSCSSSFSRSGFHSLFN